MYWVRTEVEQELRESARMNTKDTVADRRQPTSKAQQHHNPVNHPPTQQLCGGRMYGTVADLESEDVGEGVEEVVIGAALGQEVKEVAFVADMVVGAFTVIVAADVKVRVRGDECRERPRTEADG